MVLFGGAGGTGEWGEGDGEQPAMPGVSRRHFLGRCAVGVAAASVSSTAAGAATNDDPDARLRAAWGDYRTALTAFRNAGFDISDAENDRLDAELTRCENAMDALPALTPEGHIIKALYRLALWSEDIDLSNAIIAGTPIDHLKATDRRDRADLAAIRDLLAMGAGALTA